MQRRQVLKTLGLFAVGTAGCSEAPSPTPAPPQGTPGNPDTGSGGSGITTRSPLRVGNDYTISKAPNGDVLLELTVTNPAAIDRLSTLRISASLGDEDTEIRKRLELASGESRDLSIVIGFDYDAWEEGSTSLSFNFDYLS